MQSHAAEMTAPEVELNQVCPTFKVSLLTHHRATQSPFPSVGREIMGVLRKAAQRSVPP